MYPALHLPFVINLARSLKGKIRLSFTTSEVLRLHRNFLECFGKYDKCLETLLGENVVVACTYRQPIPK